MINEAMVPDRMDSQARPPRKFDFGSFPAESSVVLISLDVGITLLRDGIAGFLKIVESADHGGDMGVAQLA